MLKIVKKSGLNILDFVDALPADLLCLGAGPTDTSSVVNSGFEQGKSASEILAAVQVSTEYCVFLLKCYFLFSFGLIRRLEFMFLFIKKNSSNIFCL